MNSDGTDIQTVVDLPNYSWIGSPCWSHDGKKIAFDGTVSGFENDHIFVVDAAGGESHDIGLGSQPSWSPDDKQLCFFTLANNPSNEKAGIYVMNADGQSRQFVSKGTKGRWSPDGAHIAYLDRNDGVTTIWLYNILDAESKPHLKERFTNLSPPVWSNDGKQICFVGRRNNNREFDLCTIDVEEETNVTTKFKEQLSDVTPCWSPGKKILFGVSAGGQRSAQPCWLDPRNGDAPTPIDCDVVNFWDPCWSPDMKHIVFRCDR